MRQKPSGDLNTLTPVLKNNVPADVWFHAIRARSSGATSHSLSRLRAEVGRLVMCWCVFWAQTINSHIILGQKRMSQNAFVYQLYAVQLKQEGNSYSIVMHTFKQHAHAEFINVLSAFYYLLYWTYTQFLHLSTYCLLHCILQTHPKSCHRLLSFQHCQWIREVGKRMAGVLTLKRKK